ncbi:MAG: hypothetical protein E6I23_06895 [Chloroflexi bacterium]|nr:MAG: hypothetical protein E6I23_06895 [Chloroflexota bacterium]
MNRLATAFAIGGMLLSACGAAVAPAVSRSSPIATTTAPATSSAEASPPPADLILSDSRYGKILFDGSGRTLYLLGGGDQVVYAGHPLYYYAGDHAEGEIKCQAVVEFGGGWYVVDGNGNKITRP